MMLCHRSFSFPGLVHLRHHSCRGPVPGANIGLGKMTLIIDASSDRNKTSTFRGQVLRWSWTPVLRPETGSSSHALVVFWSLAGRFKLHFIGHVAFGQVRSVFVQVMIVQIVWRLPDPTRVSYLTSLRLPVSMGAGDISWKQSRLIGNVHCIFP